MNISSVCQTSSIFRFSRSILTVLLVFAISNAFARPASSCQQSEMTTAAVAKPATDTTNATIVPASQAISTTVLEKDYGLQIIRVAVTAAGGMVDFRFKVLDPEKAKKLVKNNDQLPSLVVDDGAAVLNPANRLVGNVQLKKDAVCMILYPNARNSVKPGVPVSPIFGNVRVDPIKAQ